VATREAADVTTLGWLALAYVGWGLLVGYRRGFLYLAVSLLGYVVAFWVARRYYRALADAATRAFHLGGVLHTLFPILALGSARSLILVLSFALLVVAVEAVARFVAAAARGVSRVPLFGSFNRLLGALMGGVEHLVVVGLVLMVLVPFLHPGGSPLSLALAHPLRLPAFLRQILPSFRP
jgi:uncharacterized membrane protein required for colicin V production